MVGNSRTYATEEETGFRYKRCFTSCACGRTAFGVPFHFALIKYQRRLVCAALDGSKFLTALRCPHSRQQPVTGTTVPPAPAVFVAAGGFAGWTECEHLTAVHGPGRRALIAGPGRFPPAPVDRTDREPSSCVDAAAELKPDPHTAGAPATIPGWTAECREIASLVRRLAACMARSDCRSATKHRLRSPSRIWHSSLASTIVSGRGPFARASASGTRGTPPPSWRAFRPPPSSPATVIYLAV